MMLIAQYCCHVDEWFKKLQDEKDHYQAKLHIIIGQSKKNIQFIYTAILYLRLINTYCHGLQTNFVYYEPTTTEIG